MGDQTAKPKGMDVAVKWTIIGIVVAAVIAVAGILIAHLDSQKPDFPTSSISSGTQNATSSGAGNATTNAANGQNSQAGNTTHK